MRKMLLLALTLSASLTALAPPPPAAAVDCYWFCHESGTVICACPRVRDCPWPPPPIACP
jgi:hypothetical protein